MKENFTTIDDDWEPTDENIARLPNKFREWMQKRTDEDYGAGYEDGFYDAENK